jgi:hypothetical protein
MPKYGDGIDLSFQAKNDLNSYQYHFVESEGPASGSSGVVDVGTGGSNTGPLGVLQNDPNVGEAAAVRMIGSTLLYVNAAGSTITFGRLLTCGSDGHGEPVSYSAGATGSAYIGHAIALDYTTSDGVAIECWIQPYMLVQAAS